MSESREIRRKRLLFRSWHRGTREVDLLLGPFAERHLAELSPAELDRYEALLGENDGDLFDWITGRVAPPEEHAKLLRERLVPFRHRPRGA